MTWTLPLGRYCFRFLPRPTLVPLGQIRLLRAISFGKDSLFPPYDTLKDTGKSLVNPFLKMALADDEMGTWSMSPASLNFLESEIRKWKPNLVLELGSGLSTLCLAQYMREARPGSDHIHICSIEQNAAVVESTLGRLKAAGLEEHVRIFHAPLSEQTIEGLRTTCYVLPHEFRATMEIVRPDFVVIDGPAAEDGARFGTLPLIRPYLDSSAHFYLDDALRDGEIDIANRWEPLPHVTLNGIYLTEKGILLGQILEQVQ
jgi:Methyltransferase domain